MFKMGAASSALSRLRNTSREQFFRDRFSCLVPRRNFQPETKVIVFSQCTTDFALQCAVSLIETSTFVVRVHATTDDYVHIQRLGDKILLKYLNKELFLHKIDLADENSTKETMMEIFNMEGTIDVFVCHIDEISNGPVHECQKQSLTSTFDANFFSSLTLMKAMIPIFKSQKRGQIIYLNTIASIIGLPNYSIYSSAKFAVERLLESLASECLQHNVKFSVIQTPLQKACNKVLELEATEVQHEDQDVGLPIIIEEKAFANNNQMNHLHKNFKAKKVVICIKEIMETEKPHFRYTINKECANIVREKLQDFRGTQSINEVSKFFLNIDLDDA